VRPRRRHRRGGDDDRAQRVAVATAVCGLAATIATSEPLALDLCGKLLWAFFRHVCCVVPAAVCCASSADRCASSSGALESSAAICASIWFSVVV
jgi:hypothetical protein